MSGVKVSLKASLLFDKLWQKVWSIIFKVSELFPLNAKIIQLLFFKSCILVNLWKKIILKWSFLILNTVFYFLMITNTWQFHLSKYQGLCTMWIISISFAYVELLVQVFSQSIRFNLTYCLKLSLLLEFYFMFDQTQMCPSFISSLGLFQGIICNIEWLRGRILEHWITGGT